MENIIEYEGVKITLKRGTVKDRINADMLTQRLTLLIPQIDAIGMSYRIAFSSFMTHAVKIEGDLGFNPVNSFSTDKELQASYDAFLDMDEGFYDLIDNALMSLRAAYNLKKFLPPDNLTDDEKKTTPVSDQTTEPE